MIKFVFFNTRRPFTPYCILNFRSFLISTQPKTNILSLVYPEWINWNGLYYTKDSFRFPPLSSSLSMISRDLLYQTKKILIENCKRKWPFFPFWMVIISADAAHRSMRYRKELSVMMAIPSIRFLVYWEIFLM